MKHAKPLPSAEYLLKYLNYSPDTGLLVHKFRNVPVFDKQFAGKVAGFNCYNRRKPYVVIKLHDRKYLAHRLIWKMVTGEDPIEIDHIDGNGLNNKFENLRNVDRVGNCKNNGVRKDNKSGITGVNKKGTKWEAQLQSNKVKMCLGIFDTKEEAILARLEGEIKYGFHPLHGRTPVMR